MIEFARRDAHRHRQRRNVNVVWREYKEIESRTRRRQLVTNRLVELTDVGLERQAERVFLCRAVGRTHVARLQRTAASRTETRREHDNFAASAFHRVGRASHGGARRCTRLFMRRVVTCMYVHARIENQRKTI